MFKRILIANRGEIAVRVIRACREMGIETAAAYSTADAAGLPAHLATVSVCIGPAPAAESYLNPMALLAAAEQTGCDAIHPGYGFLSENAEFSDLCRKCGITFIGPDGDTIRRLGNKSTARALMKRAGVPVVPGSDGPVETAQDGKAVAAEIGFPVLIKASAGGGGRGMRRCDSAEDFVSLFEQARAESVACFGSGEMYIEKLIVNPKHIEVQILADRQGHVIHLGERDCSVQRKNQKLIEEAPAPTLSPVQRDAIGKAAVAAARAGNYESAGTVEFVADSEGNFYFIEMNTRIQVEHPITELVTGIDLLREQIRIAAGLPLNITQKEITLNGCAIECRINAEMPAQQFRPCPGAIGYLHFPGGNGVRVDSALLPDSSISPYYDSLAAKLIVWAPTRLIAIRKMRRALEETILDGVETNLSLAHMILHHPEFVGGRYDTGFLDRHLEELLNWYTAAEAPQKEEGAQ